MYVDQHPRGLDPELTEAIIGTLLEPIIILDEKLNVIVASRSFYNVFGVEYETIRGKSFYSLGNGEWDIPALRVLLEQVIPEKMIVEHYEVTHTFMRLGKRTMVIRARAIKFDSTRQNILLSILDVTEQRKLQHDKEQLMLQKDTLLKEMRHRIANSLQLIASIILLKAGMVKSEESRLHLEDAHDRILSIATVQRNLDPTGEDSMVPMAAYLTVLCDSLARSMIGGRKPITLKVRGGEGAASPDEAIAIGLLTTELVINSLKHAFPSGEGNILVVYESEDDRWKLAVQDDSVGIDTAKLAATEGLGTSIVASLARQLEATVTRKSTSEGTIVSVAHSTFA